LYVDDRDVAVVATTSQETGLRWGPIVAGFLSALGLFLLLTLLAVAVGAATVTPDGSAPAMVATIVASVIALFTFFAGGFIAAWSGRVVDQARGALSGFLVWALWLVVVLFAGGLGIGQLFGVAGGLLSDISAPEMTQQQIYDALQAGSWRVFLALTLAAAAAALGGAVGSMVAERRTSNAGDVRELRD
jgi:hypothetical protein